MERWAEFILRHRKWVMAFWAVMLVAGIAASGPTTERFTVDIRLPNQPRTQAADKIAAEFGTGASTQPFLISVTMPERQTVSGNEAAIGQAFEDAVASVKKQ